MCNFDPDFLIALLEIERQGSFEGAARTLGLTAPAISHRIKSLEESAGGKVVKRGTPTVTTKMGQILCRYVEVINALDYQVKKDLSLTFAAHSTNKLAIKIVVDDHSLACWFLEALKSVFEKSPEWAFDVHSTPLDKTFDEINTGKCLLGITDSKKSPHGFSSIPLGTQVYRAVGSPKFVAKYFSKGVTAESLTYAPILRYNNRDDLQFQWIKEMVGEDLNPATHLLPSSHCFIAASIAEMGWCMCPSLVVDKYIASGELVELVPDRVLCKKLYWHYSRAIAKPSEILTKSVAEIALRYLQQEPVQTFKLLKKTSHNHSNSNSSQG